MYNKENRNKTGGKSKFNTPVHSVSRRRLAFPLYTGRLNIEYQIRADIKIVQLSINVGIKKYQRVISHRQDNAQIPPLPESTLAGFQYIGVSAFTDHLNGVSAWQNIDVAVGGGVAINDVAVRIFIGDIVAVVPRNGIGKSKVTTIHNGQFSVFMVDNLPKSRNGSSHPD